MQKMPWMPHKGNSGHYDGQHYVQLSVSDLDSVAFKDITGTTDKNVLVSFFEYGGSKGRITPNTSNKQGPMYVTQDVMLSGTDNQYAAISEGKFHGIIDVDTTEEGMPWTIHYDFSADGSGSAGTPSTKNTSALNFFQNDMLETGAAGTRFLKFYNFLPQVNLLTQNQIAAVSNEGDSTAQLGISVTSKRQNITFKQETMFVSDFSFSDNDAGASSGLNMVAGVYNAFGAAHVTSSATVDGTDTDLQKALFGSEDNSVEPTEYASNMGVITFDKFATISISHINRTLYGVSDEENEVFGVLQNEGGTMTFRQGADIIAKGISKGMLDDQNSQPAIQAEAGEGGSSGAEETDAFVVAVGGISTLGVDDPLKQSRIQIYGNPDKVTHIWALSVPFEDANELSFYKDSTTGAVSSVNDWEADDLSQEALQQRWNDYLQSISQLDAGQQHSGAGQSFDMYNIDNRLGYAVMSLHGSEITISSDAEPLSRATEGATGVLDIRGDIMASTKNTSWSRSNTCVY